MENTEKDQISQFLALVPESISDPSSDYWINPSSQPDPPHPAWFPLSSQPGNLTMLSRPRVKLSFQMLRIGKSKTWKLFDFNNIADIHLLTLFFVLKACIFCICFQFSEVSLSLFHFQKDFPRQWFQICPVEPGSHIQGL